jgi:hypothetical protein
MLLCRPVRRKISKANHEIHETKFTKNHERNQNMKNCKFCDHKDLPILPLRLAYIPKYRADEAPQLIADKSITPFIERAECDAIKPYKSRTKGGLYVLRTITEGFVFTWNEATDSWTAFAATWDGKFKKVAVPGKNSGTWEEAPEFACEMGAHLCLASLISIPKSDKTKTVWVGYSRVMWTQEIRAMIKENKDKIRENLMIPLDVNSLANGGALNAKHGFRVDKEGEKLSKHVPEYSQTFSWSGQVEHIFQYTHTQPCREEGLASLPRAAEAKPTGEAMYKINPNSGGIVLALKDPVGILQDINGARNQVISSYVTYFEQEQTVHEHIIANLIVEQRENMQQTPEGIDLWRKKYRPRIDEEKVNERIKRYRKRVNLKLNAIKLLATDWKLWATSKDLWDAWACYSDRHARILNALSNHMADCLEGAGSHPLEYEALEGFLTALVKDPNGRHRALALSITGDAEFLKFMKANSGFAESGGSNPQKKEGASATDKLGDTGVLNINRQTVDIMREFYDKFITWRLTHAYATARNLNESMATIGQVLNAAIARMVAQKKLEAQYLSRCFVFAAALRAEVELKIFQYTFTADQWIFDIHSTLWTHNGQKLEAGKLIEGVAKKTKTSVIKNLATQLDQISLPPNLPLNPLKNKIPIASYFTSVKGKLQEEFVKLTTETKAPRAKGKFKERVGPYQAQTHWLKSATAPLAILGIFLTGDNLLTNIADYKRRGKSFDEFDNQRGLSGVISAALGMAAVSAELISFIAEKKYKQPMRELEYYVRGNLVDRLADKNGPKKMQQLINQFEKHGKRLAPQMFGAVFISSVSRVVGGACAIGFSTADAYDLIQKGQSVSEKGGEAKLYYGATGFMMASGGLSAIASAVGAAGVLEASGVLAASAVGAAEVAATGAAAGAAAGAMGATVEAAVIATGATAGEIAVTAASPLSLGILKAIAALGKPFAFLGPWGWTGLAIAALVVYVYLSIEAENSEPTALEIWMSRCFFGKGLESKDPNLQKFGLDFKGELLGYYQALFALSVKFKWNIKALRDDSVEMEIKLPCYSPDASDYCYVIYLDGKNTGQKFPCVVHSKPSARSVDPQLKTYQLGTWFSTENVKFPPPVVGLLEGGKSVQETVHPGVLVITAKFKVNEDYFQKAVLKLEYWPNYYDMPDIKIMPKPNSNTITVGI